MSVPAIVQSRLGDEQVAAQVSLGGEDALFVTRTRTLIYRADGLLSDESVEEYPHEAERIEISEGRRKSAVELDYGIEGTETFKVPTKRLYEALHPVLAGVLNAADVTGPEETVKQTYQFSELTLVITSERVVKHVGAAVWDQDYEEFPFDDVTALDVEEGNVSSQIIIESDGRPQRIKTPSDQAREVRERIQRALLEYHGASSYEEFASEHAEADDTAEDDVESDDDESTDEEADPLAGGGVDPIDANPPELDDDGAIVEEDASVTTDERPDEATSAGTATDERADADGVEPDATGAAESTESVGTRTVEADDGAEAIAAAEAELTEEPADAGATVETAETGDASETDDANETGGTEAASGGAETTGAAASEAGDGFADSGFEPASSELEADDTEEQLQALTEAVQRQNELLAKQQRTLEKLIEELSRGR